MTIFEENLQKVKDGARFSISYEMQMLTVNGQRVITKTNVSEDLGVPHVSEPLEEIERLYERYRYSVPSERSEKLRKSHFSALPEKCLADEDIMYGEPREVARFILEFTLLAYIGSELLEWDSFAKGKWFWQSQKHPSLILLKKWFPVKKAIIL